MMIHVMMEGGTVPYVPTNLMELLVDISFLILLAYPLVICYIANWKDPPLFSGKIHDFDWAIFNSYFDITRG